MTVYLFTSGGSPVDTTTTDGSGLYSFTGLIPGDYYLDFDVSTNTAGNLDLSVTVQDAVAATDGTDSDIDPATAETIVTTLVVGENDLSWDAGYYCAPPGSLGAISITSTGGAVSVTNTGATPASQAACDGNAVAWTNLSNFTASDDSYVSASGFGNGNESNCLYINGYNFNIPSCATITGVEMTMERKYIGRRLADEDIQLLDASGAAIAGSDQSTGANWTTTDAQRNLWK